MAFKLKSRSKFVVLDSSGLKLTKKEYAKATQRYKEYEEMLKKKFKRMRQ